MRINDKGLALIKEFEGCKLKAYPDPATGGKPWTIGYGSTEGVKPGMVITQDEAVERLKKDISGTETMVTALLKTVVTSNQFSALVCFAFNVGVGNLKASALLKRVNMGDFMGAAEQFVRWNKAAGVEMKGLTRRRLAERDLFLA